ncbi:MAG: hypothetical protein V4505_00985 [Pseudomonadota bacterium]
MTETPPSAVLPVSGKTIEILLDQPVQLRLESDTQQLVIQALTTEPGTAEAVGISVRFSGPAGAQLLELLQTAMQQGVLGISQMARPTLQ